MTITRFTGTDVPGWYGPKPGGGMQGLTMQLDKTVHAAAEDLQQAFDGDIEIRFNADQRSGGAWLVTKDKNNARVGICAALPRYGKCQGVGSNGTDCHCSDSSGDVITLYINHEKLRARRLCKLCAKEIHLKGWKAERKSVEVHVVYNPMNGKEYHVSVRGVGAAMGWIGKWVPKELLDSKTR